MKQLVVNSSTAQQLYVDYVNAANTVSSYTTAITNVKLPALVTPPANYGGFATSLGSAQLHVRAWSDEAVPDFSVIPSSFINFNALIQPGLIKITGDLNRLKASPGDPAIISSLALSLKDIISEISPCKQAVDALNRSVSSYQQKIAGDSANLAILANKTVEAEKVDQKDIDKLKSVFDNLQAIIDERNELATLDLLSNIVEGIFLTFVSVALGLIFVDTPGILIGTGFGLGSLAFTTFVPINDNDHYQQSIEDIQTQINDVNAEIGMLSSSVAFLQTLAGQFDKIVSQSSDVSKKIQNVLSFWENQENAISQLINDLDDIFSKENSDIDGAITDVQNASKSWSELEKSMDVIKNVKYIIKHTPAYTEPAVQS
jgi:hypothetical protein